MGVGRRFASAMCSRFYVAVGYALVLLGEIAKQWRHEIDHVVVLLHRKLCTTQPLGKRDAAFGNLWLAGQYRRWHLVQDFWQLTVAAGGVAPASHEIGRQ
jgi:hypothetical protein